MKSYLIIPFSILTMVVFGQKIKKKSDYKRVQTYFTDLNNDGFIDTITIGLTLGNNRNFNFGDSHSFNTITVKLAGYKAKSFLAEDSWTDVDKQFLDSNKNALNTKMLFLKKTLRQAVIVLFGEIDGAGYRGEFSIINIENNEVKMVFDHYNDDIYVEAPTTVKPFGSSSRLCFIYRQIFEFEEPLKNGQVGVYSPFFVYSIDDNCKLNKPLTKAYNEKYYVFAGYQYSERIRVYYPNNKGKPILLKKKRSIQ